MYAFYRQLLQSRPFTAQILTAGIAGTLFGVGDAMAQHVYEPMLSSDNKQHVGKGHDFKRTLRMISYGCLIAVSFNMDKHDRELAPASWTWLKFLERSVVFKSPFQSIITSTFSIIQAAATRMLIDQVLFAPAFISVFFSYNGLVDGKSVSEISSDLNASFIDTLLANYRVWPAVQLANFYLVPLQYRLAVVNIVALGWNGYLSLKHKQLEKQ